MAAGVGSIYVDFIARTGKFVQDTGKAEKALSSFQTTANKSLNAVEKAFRKVGGGVVAFTKSLVGIHGAIGLAAGAAGFGLLVKNSLEAADAIDKTSKRLTLTTSQLQEFRFAATIAGVQVDKFEASFQRFSTGIGDALQGKGALKDVFKTLDIELRNAAGTAKTSEQLFNELANAIAAVENPTVRASLAAAAFGRRDGAAMVNMLNLGAEGMNRLRQQARDLGLVMSKDLIDNASAAKDKLEILGFVIRTKMMVAAVQLAPEIDKMATALIDALPVITALITGVARLASNLTILLHPLDAISVAALKAAIRFKEFFGQISSEDADAAIKRLNDSLMRTSNTVTKLGPEIQNTDESFSDFGNTVVKSQKDFDATRTATERYAIEIARLNQLLKEGAISQQVYDRSVDNARQTLYNATKQYDVFGNALLKTTDDLLAGNITSWKDWGRSIVSILSDVLKQFLASQIAMSSSKAFGLTGSLLGSLGNLSGFQFGLGGFGGIPFGGFAGVAHTGGKIGSSNFAQRKSPAGTFAGAHRYHGGGTVGLAEGEVPIIAKKGEHVLTPQQMDGITGNTINLMIDARGAASGVEKDILIAINALRREIPVVAVRAVQSAKQRNPDLF